MSNGDTSSEEWKNGKQARGEGEQRKEGSSSGRLQLQVERSGTPGRSQNALSGRSHQSAVKCPQLASHWS
jgi:hypothetical protein